jgi:hypothetical protein
MASIGMKIIGCKPLAVLPRNILKIENCKPFLYAILTSGIYGDTMKAYTDLFQKIEVYDDIKQDIKGVIK